jgi:hypothetical protein
MRVYVFLVTGIGMAGGGLICPGRAGHPVVFNAIIVGLWMNDFRSNAGGARRKNGRATLGARSGACADRNVRRADRLTKSCRT